MSALKMSSQKALQNKEKAHSNYQLRSGLVIMHVNGDWLAKYDE